MRNIVENDLMCMIPLSVALFHITNVFLCFIRKGNQKCEH